MQSAFNVSVLLLLLVVAAKFVVFAINSVQCNCIRVVLKYSAKSFATVLISLSAHIDTIVFENITITKIFTRVIRILNLFNCHSTHPQFV